MDGLLSWFYGYLVSIFMFLKMVKYPGRNDTLLLCYPSAENNKRLLLAMSIRILNKQFPVEVEYTLKKLLLHDMVSKNPDGM